MHEALAAAANGKSARIDQQFDCSAVVAEALPNAGLDAQAPIEGDTICRDADRLGMLRAREIGRQALQTRIQCGHLRELFENAPLFPKLGQQRR